MEQHDRGELNKPDDGKHGADHVPVTAFDAFYRVVCGVLLTLLVLAICDSFAQSYGSRAGAAVLVKTGPHAGRVGLIVSAPWLGSLYNKRPTVNVAATEAEIRVRYVGWGDQINGLLNEMRAGHGPREWIKVWRSDCVAAEVDEYGMPRVATPQKGDPHGQPVD